MISNIPAIAVSVGNRFSNAYIVRIRILIKKWYQNYRTRKELESMSDYILKDIGISRSQAEEEYAKPFWRE